MRWLSSVTLVVVLACIAATSATPKTVEAHTETNSNISHPTRSTQLQRETDSDELAKPRSDEERGGLVQMSDTFANLAKKFSVNLKALTKPQITEATLLRNQKIVEDAMASYKSLGVTDSALEQLKGVERKRVTDVQELKKGDGKSLIREDISDIKNPVIAPDYALISKTGRENQVYEDGRKAMAAVVISRDVKEGGGDVLLISSTNPSKGDWLLPKGGWNTDEVIQHAAMREATEEGGTRAHIIAQLRTMDFDPKPKQGEEPQGYRYYPFLMKAGKVYDQWSESMRYRIWVSYDDAIKLLEKRPQMADIVRAAKEYKPPQGIQLKEGEFLDENTGKLVKLTMNEKKEYVRPGTINQVIGKEGYLLPHDEAAKLKYENDLKMVMLLDVIDDLRKGNTRGQEGLHNLMKISTKFEGGHSVEEAGINANLNIDKDNVKWKEALRQIEVAYNAGDQKLIQAAEINAFRVLSKDGGDLEEALKQAIAVSNVDNIADSRLEKLRAIMNVGSEDSMWRMALAKIGFKDTKSRDKMDDLVRNAEIAAIQAISGDAATWKQALEDVAVALKTRQDHEIALREEEIKKILKDEGKTSAMIDRLWKWGMQMTNIDEKEKLLRQQDINTILSMSEESGPKWEAALAQLRKNRLTSQTSSKRQAELQRAIIAAKKNGKEETIWMKLLREKGAENVYAMVLTYMKYLTNEAAKEAKAVNKAKGLPALKLRKRDPTKEEEAALKNLGEPDPKKNN